MTWFPAAVGLAWCGAWAAGSGWKLAWSDEFSGPSVDAAAWGFETGYLRNEELQYYSNRAQNSRIEDGRLLIQALRDGWNGNPYTSASRTTHGKKSWKYGRFELRARIDTRPGSWPAWWWLPESGGWPRGGEIDMMEAFQGKCLFNVMDGDGKWSSSTRTVAGLGGDRWSGSYHTWVMEWDSTRIDLSLDGVLMNHFPLSQADGTGPGGSNPFRQAGYFIVNQAIGGTSGGDPSATAFPVEYRIDWIRAHAWTDGPAHQVTVIGGAGSGTYIEGAQVSLTAGQAPSGQVFDRWVVSAGTADITDIGAEDTRLAMPAADVSVTAAFKKSTGLPPLPGRGNVPRHSPSAIAVGPGTPLRYMGFSPAGRMILPEPHSPPAAGFYFIP